MALKRLPNDVQSLLSASAHVNTFKRAIEELIYNSLDAESTSIAIRIHIQESSIQVIDNGCGIAKHDFNLIGQRFVTSKVNDIETLKAAPKNYGFRGEFLANIITISHMVKITSRHLGKEDTWAKTFSNGKEKKFAKMTTRPSHGTTVDIKGFLHNLNIQRRGIDAVNEMQHIKLFLEQLTLVHNNISISLRDDSKNEIAFKIHKKRDVYQTLSTLFDIDKADVLELQVEKHEHKVKGLIGKTDKVLDLHWIYLNGKCLPSCSKLHKIVNENFMRSLHIKDHRRLKSKKTFDENQLFNQNVPFYLIFLTCPYIDYEISFTPRQSVVEFNDWEQINKLLEKLVKFYVGDVNLKEIKKPENKCKINEHISVNVNQDTRNQVKKIMEKILGSNSKKIGVSQLQNGIKGKLIKRKVKKKPKRSDNLSKLLQIGNKPNSDDKILAESNADHILERSVEHMQLIEDNLDKNSLPEFKNEIIKVHDTKKDKLGKKPRDKKKKETKTKTKIMSSANKIVNITNKKLKISNKKFQYLNSETDSVYKRSKIVAQKVEDFLRRGVLKKTNTIVNRFETRNANRRELELKNSIYLREKNEPNDVNKLELLRLNKYLMNKLKLKSYKTTYDLIQTVMQSQQEVLNVGENNFSNESYKGFQKRNEAIHFISKRKIWTNKCVRREYSNTDHKIGNEEQYIDESPTRYNAVENEDNFSGYQSPYNRREISNFILNIPETIESVATEFYNRGRNFNCTQKEISLQTLSRPLTILTYDSHQHHKNEAFVSNDIANCDMTNRKHNIRFMTKQSAENFVTSNDFKAKYKKSSKTVSKQPKFYDICMRQRINKTLYTVEYTKSTESNNYSARNNVTFVKENGCMQSQSNENEFPINNRNPVDGNTYTLNSSNQSFDLNTLQRIQTHSLQNPMKSHELFETYTINNSESVIKNDYNGPVISNNDYMTYKNNINYVFVSKPQHTQTETSKDVSMEPLNMCETVFNDIETEDGQLVLNENYRLNDSLYNNFINVDDGMDEWVENALGQIIEDNAVNNVTENVSHHFAQENYQPHVIANVTDKYNEISNSNGITEVPLNQHIENNLNATNTDCNFEMNSFNLKNRHRFVPKGMSQIFENCRTKGACDYNLDKEYYEDIIYNNFAKEVQVNTEIYEPVVQNVDDHATKNIYKFQSKVKKDNASLIFDETSLKEVKVLGQVDCKFIGAIMKKRICQTEEATEYLILFDQHAVHERIRLERNLTDYLNEEKWTCVTVENITLKMSKDQILYLHNYKDKFTQLGLQWTIVNDNEVNVHSIPEAILGKNPREVEKVIKAVRNLIIEEINVIKLQKGCLSLHPKSIMDLVFSEACRYAIKFGDQLSKNDCIELLNALSNCKTPFQCAHGRPVMAVIMDIRADSRDYKINMSKLKQFRGVK